MQIYRDDSIFLLQPVFGNFSLAECFIAKLRDAITGGILYTKHVCPIMHLQPAPVAVILLDVVGNHVTIGWSTKKAVIGNSTIQGDEVLYKVTIWNKEYKKEYNTTADSIIISAPAAVEISYNMTVSSIPVVHMKGCSMVTGYWSEETLYHVTVPNITVDGSSSKLNESGWFALGLLVGIVILVIIEVIIVLILKARSKRQTGN